MKKAGQIILLLSFIVLSVLTFGLLYMFNVIEFSASIGENLTWIIFAIAWVLMINEGLIWIKNGKRSEWGDLVIIGFLFVTVYLFTNDIFDSFIGAFSIYMILGIFELKEYEVLNKILLITVITYNFIFFAAIIDKALDPTTTVIRDTAFSLSFWLMLILGFMFFGRKYIIVWRFMSPQYLTLALYLIAWLGVTSISKFTPYNIMDNIYEVLIVTNLIIYALTGPLLDKMLGMKATTDPILIEIVNEVAPKVGLDPKKIKIRFGQYPILNAMAYGAFWDMRMGIIAPDINKIPKDELKGIVAHELAHLKGKHTLSLTMISLGELVVRKILSWPATYYDYTFAPDDQPFPMFVFILINFLLYIFIYVFVRMFEAQADLNTKRAGYGPHLAKGLYNLESFYSYGREIGLNTMLLCDEKITEENRMMDYLTTAEYLNKMVIKPSKGALISNFLNSHPPSYHRIIAALHDKDIPIAQEALMPITFLKKKKAHKFFMETQEARKKFIAMATSKIKEEFNISSISELLDKIHRKDEFSHKIGKTYAYRNLETKDIIFGTLQEVKFEDNACESYRYQVSTQKDGKSVVEIINPSINQEVSVSIGENYLFSNELGPMKLKNLSMDSVYVDPEKKSKKQTDEEIQANTGVLTFEKLEDSTEVLKPLFNVKIPRSAQYIQSFEGKPIIFKEKSEYNLFKIDKVEFTKDFKNFTLKLNALSHTDGTEEISEDIKTVNKEDVIIRFGKPFVPIYNDELTNKSESKIFDFIVHNKLRVNLYLKKAVNNEEDGFIQTIEKEDSKIKSVNLKTIFDIEKEIVFQKIDAIFIDEPIMTLQLKEEISGVSMMINKISAKFHPERLLI
jgi:Zn-dependent protease with chaperone function